MQFFEVFQKKKFSSHSEILGGFLKLFPDSLEENGECSSFHGFLSKIFTDYLNIQRLSAPRFKIVRNFPDRFSESLRFFGLFSDSKRRSE